MTNEEYQKLRNKQEASIPGKYYPGYKEIQAKGGFNSPPAIIDIPALMNLARKIVGFLKPMPSIKAQESNVIGDPSQMKITYGAQPSSQPTIQSKLTGISKEQVQQGFLKYGANTPLATQSGVISQALSLLSPQIDPKLILALALKESGGGRDLINRDQGINNNYNVKYGGKLINYPDLQTALLGGENKLEGSPSRGLINILNGPLYEKYRKSGNLEDFFNTYSKPEAGNPSMEDQLNNIRILMKNWQ